MYIYIYIYIYKVSTARQAAPRNLSPAAGRVFAGWWFCCFGLLFGTCRERSATQHRLEPCKARCFCGAFHKICCRNARGKPIGRPSRAQLELLYAQEWPDICFSGTNRFQPRASYLSHAGAYKLKRNCLRIRCFFNLCAQALQKSTQRALWSKIEVQ